MKGCQKRVEENLGGGATRCKKNSDDLLLLPRWELVNKQPSALPREPNFVCLFVFKEIQAIRRFVYYSQGFRDMLKWDLNSECNGHLKF